MSTHKIVVVGSAESGKTTFLRRHLTGEFTCRYVPTMGVETHVLSFQTSHGPIQLNTWDCAGKPEFRGLEEGYWKGAEGAIIFFDLGSPDSWREVSGWLRKLQTHTGLPSSKIVLCGNKVEQGRTISVRSIREFMTTHQITFYNVSAKSNYNYEKPFLYLLRQLRGDENLTFLENPEVPLPEVINLQEEKSSSTNQTTRFLDAIEAWASFDRTARLRQLREKAPTQRELAFLISFLEF